MAQRMMLIAKLLSELLHPAGIVVRTDEATLRKEGAEIQAGVFSGKPPDDVLFIEEHGVRYGVQLMAGQKTGFYLDQRENRLAATKYMLRSVAQRSGRASPASPVGPSRDIATR